MTDAPTLVLADVTVGRVGDTDPRVDVVVREGVVVAIEPVGRGRGDERIDGDGGALLPGLHDHHVHLLATAAARWSLDVGELGAGDADAFAALLRERADALAPGDEVRVIGYDEAIAGSLDRHVLDRLTRGRRARVQHRTGQLWVLSSAALAALGDAVHDAPAGLERDGTGEPTGRCWRIDGWLRASVPTADTARTLRDELGAVADELFASGVTGCTDATPFASLEDAAPLLDAVAAGRFPLALTLMGGPAMAATTLPSGIGRGPVKLLFDDHDPPSFDDLVDAVHMARAVGRPIAIHCVTRAGLALAIALLDAVPGPGGDRIEHGAVVPTEAVAELRRLGVTVVTQPAFPVVRGERYLRDVDAADVPHLWPCARLIAAGVPVAAGSDAPYGPLDPWTAVAAAASRRAADERPVGSDPPISVRQALDLYLGTPDEPGRPRRVEVGAPADLVLLDRPLDALPCQSLAGSGLASFRTSNVPPRAGTPGPGLVHSSSIVPASST